MDDLALTDNGDLTWTTTVDGAEVAAYDVTYQPIVSTSVDDNDGQTTMVRLRRQHDD